MLFRLFNFEKHFLKMKDTLMNHIALIFKILLQIVVENLMSSPDENLVISYLEVDALL